MNWYVINKEYVKYLKQFDNKVENIDYGDNKLKPYIGIVFNCNNFNYYVPISSYKSKYDTMRENIDFIKVTNFKKTLGVINLNNMIPVFNEDIEMLNYSDISKYRTFKNKTEEIKYVAFLRAELSIINSRKKDICNNAQKIYDEKIKNPNSRIARRTVNFELLEDKCIEYSRVNLLLQELKNISSKEVLYYIYDKLNDKETFEETVYKLDTVENSDKIQNLTADEINNLIKRSEMENNITDEFEDINI